MMAEVALIRAMQTHYGRRVPVAHSLTTYTAIANQAPEHGSVRDYRQFRFEARIGAVLTGPDWAEQDLREQAQRLLLLETYREVRDCVESIEKALRLSGFYLPPDEPVWAEIERLRELITTGEVKE